MQIFALNARLAAAESMTHDVIRDLLGVKLDMTNYAVNLRILCFLYSVVSFVTYYHSEYIRGIRIYVLPSFSGIPTCG